MTESPIDVARALERLNRRFAEAKDELHLAALSARPWESEVLWRVAVATRIDRDAVLNIVQPAVADLPLDFDLWDWLLDHPDIDVNNVAETVGMRDRSSRVVRSSANDLGWSDEIQRIREFARKLGDYFLARRNDWELDGISLLVIGDTKRAWNSAVALYVVAERNTDFTRCFQILQLLEERTALIQKIVGDWHPPMALFDWLLPFNVFQSEITELRRRYDAARTFAADFERTTKVLERRVMEDAWTWLTQSSAPSATSEKTAPTSKPEWILDVEAQGGAGKTIFLRWLSARRCIVHGVPYARLDFDFVDPRLTSIAPWYLVAQCARILDAQLEGRPLREIVARADEVASFDSFSLGAKQVSRAMEQLRSERANEIGGAVIGQLGRALEASKAKAVVIVLDTLETAFLDQGADVQQLLWALAEIHRVAPKLRVILSGRFNIEKSLPQYKEHFRESTRPLLLDRLSDEECAEYLRTVRGIQNAAVADAIIARCGGLPFALSMFADEYELNPELSVDEINSIPGPELHYLVERVLKRVPPQIAWLLRYGVAAKQLTKTFLADVIVPELEQMREGKSVDDPLLGNEIVARYYDAKKFALGEIALSADLLWEDLERYASQFSFVDRNAAVPNCLVIHSEVIGPLRAELHDSAIMRKLHQRAMQLAESRSQELTVTNENEWAEERATALYHAFRLSNLEGEQVWRESNAQAMKKKQFEAQATISNELLEVPNLSPEFRVLGARYRTEAFIELARKQDAEYAMRANEARESWNAWSRCFTSKDSRDVAFHIGTVRMLALVDEKNDESLGALDIALATTQKSAERLQILRALVEGGAHRAVTIQHVNSALELLATGQHDWNSQQVVQFKTTAISVFARQGKIGEALQLATEIALLKGQSNSAAIQAFTWQLELLTSCDRMSEVAQVLQQALLLDSKIEHDGFAVDIEALEARNGLRYAAIRAFDYGGPTPPSSIGLVPGYPDLFVGNRLADAQLCRHDMRPAEALAKHQEARGAQGASTFSIARVISDTCGIATNLLFDYRRAGESMAELSSLTLFAGSNPWLDFHIKSCILKRPWANESLTKLRDFNNFQPSISTSISVCLVEITLVADRFRDASLELVQLLSQIEPIEARRRIFFELVFGARDVELHPDARMRLAAALGMSASIENRVQSETVAVVLQNWMLNKWIAPDRVAELQPLTVRNALDLSKWYCDTECRGRFVGLTDEMLNASDISEFARGISFYASAAKAVDERDIEKATAHAQRSRDILASESIPASLWLARANLLLYRLNAGGAADSEVHLLTAEDLCERLGAQQELGMVRDLLNLRKLGEQLTTDRKSILSFAVNPQDVAALTDTRTAIVTAFNSDVARTTALRTPNNVVAELSKNFFGCIRELAALVPVVANEYTANVHLAVVSSHPAVAALPLEISIAKYVAQRESTAPHLLIPGWRSVEPLHESVNESWVLRALNSLGIKSESGTGDLRALTSTFQSQQQLPENGVLDAPTLRQMIRALRGNRETRIAIIPARTQPWIGAAHEVLTRFYSQAKAEIAILSGATRETITTLQSRQFDVVHMFAPVVESSSYGGLAFSLQPTTTSYTQSNAYAEDPSAESGNPYLSLSELIGAIKRPSSLLRPVVVVHNTLDNLPLEDAIRQYCMRNIMCMELNRSGAPVAAVGISTKVPINEVSAAALLASVLTNGEPLIEFLNKIGPRDPAQDALEVIAGLLAKNVVDELHVFGSVVYATNPEFVIV